MNKLEELYGTSLSPLTDLYELTMAYGYWKSGISDKEAVFHLFYRKNPFKGGYAVACGLESVINWVKLLKFSDRDAEYLKSLKGNDGKALFEVGFLDYLSNLEFSCNISAIPEGTVVFPFEPLIRVQGPIIQAQIIETALLNMINFQTLIATRAARTCFAAKGAPILEFGLRRAQGIDGSLTASRAAYIGGCSGTSNVLAGRLHGIPVKGTHAHSWVLCFDSEVEAFDVYAETMPNNCVFLVDTYDTITGVYNAVKIGKKLRERGHEMLGIRLDSGDLAYLSIKAREILDKNGFSDAKIVASNDLNEFIIQDLRHQGAMIDVYGVGTNLVTASDQPALGGVYKLTAIRSKGKEWEYKLKLSEQMIKISNPGILQVRRFRNKDRFIGDLIFDNRLSSNPEPLLIDPMDQQKTKVIHEKEIFNEDLLVPIFEKGKCVYETPHIDKIKARVVEQLSFLHESIKRFKNSHIYPVGLEKNLNEKKINMIKKLREQCSNP